MKASNIKKLIQQRVSSKTYRYGVAITVLGYLQSNFPLIADYLGPYQDAVLMGLGLGICLLREITKEPLSEKGNANQA